LEGYRDYTLTSWDAKKAPVALFTGGRVERTQIKSYFNDFYHSGMQVYNRYKRFGLPYSGGWAEQPEYLLDIIECFEDTIHAWNGKKAQRIGDGSSRGASDTRRGKSRSRRP